MATASSQGREVDESASAASDPHSIGNTTNVNTGTATLVDYEPPVAEEAAEESIVVDEEPELNNVNLGDTVPIPRPASQTQRISETPHTLKAETVSAPAVSDRRSIPAIAPENTERRIRPRVEKLRKGTSIVIDEASYDPSLRFVLIAGVLFLLFVVLLILSKWIG